MVLTETSNGVVYGSCIVNNSWCDSAINSTNIVKTRYFVNKCSTNSSFDHGVNNIHFWYECEDHGTSNAVNGNIRCETNVGAFRAALTAFTNFSEAWYEQQLPLSERLKNVIHNRLTPFIRTDKGVQRAKDIREERARGTLRRIIGEDRFRLFLKKGFVSTRAKSGLTYQIFPGSYFTNVFDNQGKQLDRLCVVLRGNYTPTDTLIVRYLMIMSDEANFRKTANVHSPSVPLKQQPVNSQESLSDIFKRLKKEPLQVVRPLYKGTSSHIVEVA